MSRSSMESKSVKSDPCSPPSARGRETRPQEDTNDQPSRVAPFHPCVERAGSTAEKPLDVVTDAKRTDTLAWCSEHGVVRHERCDTCMGAALLASPPAREESPDLLALIRRIVTGDGQQLENLDMTWDEWADSAGVNDDGDEFEITIAREDWFALIRAAGGTVRTND